MIEKYWSEVFGQFQTENGSFKIPGFPEQLMSCHFGHTNIIGKIPEESSHSLTLCELVPIKSTSINNGKKEKLIDVLEKSEFWNFQNLHNKEALPFIQRLLPFLLTLSTPHFNFSIYDGDRLTASALMGVSDCGCFLFNLSVDRSFRKNGLAKKLVLQMRESFPEKRMFYWTKHKWFTLGSSFLDYHLLSAMPER